MKKNKFTLVSNIVCFVLLAVLFAMQFLPFWNCTGCTTHEDGMISISEYVWNTRDHRALTKNMTDVYKDKYGPDMKDEKGKPWEFEANDVVNIPVFITICVILGVIFMLSKPNTVLTSLCACVGGFTGVIGYLTNVALQAGQNWVLHLVVACVVAVATAVLLAISAYKFVRKYI